MSVCDLTADGRHFRCRHYRWARRPVVPCPGCPSYRLADMIDEFEALMETGDLDADTHPADEVGKRIWQQEVCIATAKSRAAGVRTCGKQKKITNMKGGSKV